MLVAVGSTVAVIIFMDWVPTPLNQNITHTRPAERLPGRLIHGLTGTGVFTANLLGRRWPIFTGAVWYSVVLASAIANWWVSYLCGVYAGEISPETYLEEYRDNLTVLPPFRGHPVVPDVQHTLIHAGLLLSCVLSWRVLVRSQQPTIVHPGWSVSAGGSLTPGSPETSRP